MQHGHGTYNMDTNMHNGHEHAAWTRTWAMCMYHGHGHTAWTRTYNMDIDMVCSHRELGEGTVVDNV